MRLKPLLIGQAPGPNTNPALPLYPHPRTIAGGRLQQLIGISPLEYLDRFDRINLLNHFPGRYARDDKFPPRDARIAAQAIRPLLAGRHVILVGRNVATAFGLENLLWHSWALDMANFHVAVIPHTSGRNPWYGKPDNRAASRAFWDDLLGRDKWDLPFSEAGSIIPLSGEPLN